MSVLVKTKPVFIAIEDLNVKGMMKNRHLSRAIGTTKIQAVQGVAHRKVFRCRN